jgi:protein-S-isoprenylcysteine O-methyltransferase Ste14
MRRKPCKNRLSDRVKVFIVSTRVTALVVGIVAIWLVVGLLVTPTVRDIMLSWGFRVRQTIPLSIEGYVLFAIILALIVGTIFIGKIKGVFDRFVAGGFLVFHSFPALAWLLEPSLYIMCFPVGIFALLCSPSNPLFALPHTRWLLTVVVSVSHLPPTDVVVILYLPSEFAVVLTVFGVLLFLSGVAIFIAALLQLLRGKKLVTSGLYSVIRHPQYLGIILATLGLTLLQMDVRVISLISWMMLILAYVWLAYREESKLQEKYGEEFLAYKEKVPFILPLIRVEPRNTYS